MAATLNSQSSQSSVKQKSTAHSVDSARFELLKLTFQQIPVFSLSSVLITLGIVVILWQSQSQGHLLIWATTHIFVLLLSSYYLFIARDTDINTDNFKYWNNRLIFFSLLRGILWGVIAVEFYNPEQFNLQLFLFVFFLMMATLMASIHAAEKTVFFVVTLPILIPIAIQFIKYDDELHNTFAIATLVYFVLLYFYYIKSHITLRRSIETHLDKTKHTEQLKTQKQEAEQANLDKSRFLASASHDLRQPIHAQTLLIEELSERITDPKLNDLIRDLKISTNALHELFDSLLDLSKLDSGTIEPDLETLCLRDFLDTIALEYKGIAKSKNIEFKVKAPDYNIKTDRSLLNRIVHNLVSNAIKHTGKGRVLIAARRRGTNIRIEVRDSGRGIPDSEKVAIFNEYYQITSLNKDKSQGLGLGLSIVQRLSKLLGHPLEVISQTGLGSVFAVTVPISHSKVHIDTTQLRLKCDIDALYNNHILVIDDDKMIRSSMFSLLSHWGFTVTIAASGEEACKILKKEKFKPDVIIADYQLQRNKTGIQAIKKVNRLLKSQIPALIVTGDTAVARIQEIKSKGYKVLHKPVPPAKLRALIRFLIDEDQIIMNVG